MFAQRPRFVALACLALLAAAQAAAGTPPRLLSGARVDAPLGLPAHAKPGAAVTGVLHPKATELPALQLTLPDGRALDVRQRHVARNARFGAVTWTGAVDGSPDDLVVVTRRKGVLSGFLAYRGRTYEIRPTAAGQHVLYEVVPQSVTAKDYVRVPASAPAAREKTAAVVGRLAADSSPVVQDLLVLYTTAAADNLGNDGVTAAVISAVEAANASYRNSGVNLTLNLVGIAPSSVGEGATSEDTLAALRASADVTALRNRSGADIVMLVSEDRDVCGIAYIMATDATWFAPYAFGLVRTGCLSNQTLTHELGHIQGLAHDRETDPDPGAYPYARGYRRCTADGTAFYDIMAYRCPSVPQQTRLRTFASPVIEHLGNPTGVSYEADSLNAADGPRALNLTAATTAAFRAPVPVVPAAPSALVAMGSGSSVVSLQWRDNSAAETGFKVQRSGDGVNFVEIATLPADTATYGDATVAPATTYTYRVAAYNSAGQSQYSNNALVTTAAAPPSAPASLTASAVSSTLVSLAWTHATAGVEFVVERSTDGVQFLALPVTDASARRYDDASVTPGSTYWYRVRARGSAGLSEPSNVASATVPSVSPQVPTGLWAENNRGKTARVSWNPSTFGTVTRYEVRREQYKKKKWRPPMTVASVSAGDTVLVDASGKGTFRYAVRACNSGGCSEFSAPTGAVKVTK